MCACAQGPLIAGSQKCYNDFREKGFFYNNMAEKKFEEALDELEKIIQRLEDASIPLDEALSLFEQGIKLSRLCARKLDAAEKKVEILLRDESGTMRREPFNEPEED